MIPATTASEQEYLAAFEQHKKAVSDETQKDAENLLREVPLCIGMMAHCQSDSLNRGGVTTNSEWTGPNPGNASVGDLVVVPMECWGGASPLLVTLEVTEENWHPKRSHPGASSTDVGYGWLGKIVQIVKDGKMVNKVEN
jgi:hypothetical protein